MGFENSAGLGNRNHYGPRAVDKSFGGLEGGVGNKRRAEWVLDFGELVTQTAAGIADTTVVKTGAFGPGMEATIPAYAKILSCRVDVLEAIATTSGSAATSGSISVGLVQQPATEGGTATAIDLDGLIDATDGALTITSNNIAQPRGDYFLGGSAALVPDYGTAATPGETTSIGANPGELYFAVISNDSTGQATLTGKVRVVVEYVIEGV